MQSMLQRAGYEGYLVADAHVVYDHLYADGSVVVYDAVRYARNQRVGLQRFLLQHSGRGG